MFDAKKFTEKEKDHQQNAREYKQSLQQIDRQIRARAKGKAAAKPKVLGAKIPDFEEISGTP